MPIPLYVICSESASEDKSTGLLSLFHIIEKIQIGTHRAGEPIPRAPVSQMRVTAVWMKESMDDDHEFEFETVLIPPNGEGKVIGSGSFVFTKDLFRINSGVLWGGLSGMKNGILWIESHIRKAGVKGWQVQKSPIFIEHLPATNADSKPDKAAIPAQG